MTESRLSARNLVFGTLTVAAVAAVVWLLIRWHDVIFILFVAIVISTAIKPAVDRLGRRGLSRPAGIVTVYVITLALLSIIVLAGAPIMGEQASRIGGEVPGVYRDLRDDMLQNPNLFVWRLGLALPDRLPLSAQLPTSGNEDGAATESETQTDALQRVQQSLGRLAPIARATLGVLVTFVLAFYWTVEGERVQRASLLLLPLDRREDVRELIAALETQVGRYIVGQGLLMLSIGVLSLAGYLIMGLPYALLLAIVAGLMEAIPLVGPALGAIPAALIAYSVDPGLVLWVVIFTLVLQQVENSVLVPRIMKRSVGVHPLVTLLALTALSTLFGITGALVAVPLAAILQYLFQRYVVERRSDAGHGPAGRDLLSVVHYEAQDLVHDMRRQGRAIHERDDLDRSDTTVDELETIARSLRDLLAEDGTEFEEKGRS